MNKILRFFKSLPLWNKLVKIGLILILVLYLAKIKVLDKGLSKRTSVIWFT